MNISGTKILLLSFIFSLLFCGIAPAQVLINEIYTGDIDWIELYNTGTTPQNLLNWQLLWWDSLLGSGVYTLPYYILAPGEYLLLKEGNGNPERGTIFMNNDVKWAELRGGACAIKNNSGQGVDFVRWGDSMVQPPAGTSWFGSNPPAPLSNSSNQSLARDKSSTDTDSGADWNADCGFDASHPTPGYRNHTLLSFDSLSEFAGWVPEVIPQIFSAPSFSTDPTGKLIIRASDNNNCFGYWRSSVDAVPVVANQLYKAEFVIETDVLNPEQVPGFRFRLNPQNQQLIGMMVLNSLNGGTGEPQPPDYRKTYTLYFVPPKNAAAEYNESLDDLIVALDLFNFDPLDAPTGAIILDSLTFTLISLDDLQQLIRERHFTFDTSLEDWKFATVTPFIAPNPNWIDGALCLTALDNTNTFGYWYKENAIRLIANRLYCCRFLIGTDETDAVRTPAIRLRAHNSDFQLAYMLVINSLGDAANSPSVNNDKLYELYFEMPGEIIAGAGEPDQLILTFDILNFEPADSATATLFLKEVIIDSYAVPLYP